MVHPSLEDFRARSRQGNLVPIYREIVADLETPVSAFLKLLQGEHAFLLESVEGGETWGRYSYLGCNPSVIFRSKDNLVEIFENGKWTKETVQNPLDRLRTLMSAYKPVVDPSLPRFFGGAVGYFGYDGVKFFERVPMDKPDELKLYDSYYLITDTLVIFDRFKTTMRIVANVHIPEGGAVDAAYHDGVAKIDALFTRLRTAVQHVSRPVEKVGTIQPNMTEQQFGEIVERSKEYIRAGDVFQVVLSQRFKIQSKVDHLDLYRALRVINPSPYMFFLRLGETDVIGSSPELLVRVEGDQIDARPIAGTSPRGANDAEDKLFADKLIHDPKELAEHIMLVDLGRNDVGRVAAGGSVHVNELQVVEKYSHVMHIVSNVRGKLAPGKDSYDVVSSTFPAGTMSGAPKIRAMEIINELEPARRGLYAGCIGYFAYGGNMDQAVAIRTFVAKGETLYIQAGAGIVYDSVPEREYQECWNKARALLRAIDRAEAGLDD
jgi:anthranilate synthase component 1